MCVRCVLVTGSYEISTGAYVELLVETVHGPRTVARRPKGRARRIPGVGRGLRPVSGAYMRAFKLHQSGKSGRFAQCVRGDPNEGASLFSLLGPDPNEGVAGGPSTRLPEAPRPP